MDSLQKLLEIEYGDVFITLQATLTAKEIAKKHHSDEIKERISSFLGADEEEWRKLTTEEAVKNYYIGKIREYEKPLKR